MSTARDDQGDKTCLGARKPPLATMTTTTTTPISNTTTSATAKNLSPQPSANRNKFTLDEVGEQLRSIRKLSETSDFLSSNVIELNNNSILASSSSSSPPPAAAAPPQQQQFVAGQPLTLNQLRMDIRRSGEVPGHQDTQTGAQPASAPYTSLFSPSYGRDANSSGVRQSAPASHLQPASRQHQLRKQQAALDLELPIAAANRLPVQQVPVKKMNAFTSSPSQHKEVSSSSSTTTTTTQEDEEEDELDEVEEEDLDERLPFNANHLPKLGSGRKSTTSASPNRKRSSASPSRGSIKPQHSVISFDNKCEYVKRNSSSGNINNTKGSNKKNIGSKHHQQQARISLVDSRPPSFSACQQQPGYIHLNNNKEILAGRKLDWQHHHQQQQPHQQHTFARCNCSNCNKKFNSLALESSASYPSGPILQPASSKYPKTYSMHLVLKSIILILVTLLLSMLFLGVIMATHYMPHAIERLLNTPRTFNVTIATG